MPIGYPGNSISKEARAKAGGGYESAMAVTPPPSGDLLPGQEITLSGGNYGAGPTLIMTSDAENLADGAEINGAASQYGYKDISTQFGKNGTISADGNFSHSGTKSIKVTWDETSISSAFGVASMNANTNELRMLYWRYQNWIFDTVITDSNMKMFYVFGTGTGEAPEALFYIPRGQAEWRIYNNIDGQATTDPIRTFLFEPGFSQGKWVLWDMYIKNNSGDGVLDGKFHVRANGKKVLENNAYPFQEFGLTGTFKDIRLGHMAEAARSSEVWYDEVIFSEGRQAIWVSTSATWDDTDDQVLAAQVPKTWDGSITFDLNASTLPTGVDLYAFVEKADGTITSGELIGSLA